MGERAFISFQLAVQLVKKGANDAVPTKESNIIQNRKWKSLVNVPQRKPQWNRTVLCHCQPIL